jgi:polyribonucleotide nucleotidyltransferase
MLGAVVFGHEQMQAAINAINELVEEAGKPEWDWQMPPARDEALWSSITGMAEGKLQEAYRITQKQARSQRVNEINEARRSQDCRRSECAGREHDQRITSSTSKRASSAAAS